MRMKYMANKIKTKIRCNLVQSAFFSFYLGFILFCVCLLTTTQGNMLMWQLTQKPLYGPVNLPFVIDIVVFGLGKKKQARNLEQKREWALQLKRVILENYDAVIPHHARQLVLQLGQDQRCNQERPASNSGGQSYDRGDYAYSATSSGSHSGSSSAAHHVKRHQHSAPEYLERRKHSTAGLTAKGRSRKGRKLSHDGSSPREVSLSFPVSLFIRRHLIIFFFFFFFFFLIFYLFRFFF